MKIIVWNIEKFTESKFLDSVLVSKSKHFTKKRRIESAYDKEFYLTEIVGGWGKAANTPDVFAVLEVLAEKDLLFGQPLGDTYSDGVTAYLENIKEVTENDDWRVVPPIKCNPPKPKGEDSWAAQEAVAVFYNSATVDFEGPDYWDGKMIRRNTLRPKTFPAPWDDPEITGATTRSGRVAQTNAAGNTLLFPNEMNRRPFMVDFRERTGLKRLMRLLFLHTSPQYGVTGSSVTGTQRTAEIADMNPATRTTAAKPEYYVICGDFNVNAHVTYLETAASTPLTTLGYQQKLTPANSKSTHLDRLATAIPFFAPFGYSNYEIIDNFYILKDGPFQPRLTNIPGYAIDAVEGSPPPWGTTMGMNLATIIKLPTGKDLAGPTATFRQWSNFGSVIASSDHLPIFLNIP